MPWLKAALLDRRTGCAWPEAGLWEMMRERLGWSGGRTWSVRRRRKAGRRRKRRRSDGARDWQDRGTRPWAGSRRRGISGGTRVAAGQAAVDWLLGSGGDGSAVAGHRLSAGGDGAVPAADSER